MYSLREILSLQVHMTDFGSETLIKNVQKVDDKKKMVEIVKVRK